MLRSRPARGSYLNSSTVPLKRSRKRRIRNSRKKDYFSPLLTVCGIVALSTLLLFVGFRSTAGNGGATSLREKFGNPRYLRDSVVEEGIGADTENDNDPLLSIPKLHNINLQIPTDSIYTQSLPAINREDGFFSLSSLAGRIAVVINVACAWGKTATVYGQIKRILSSQDPHHQSSNIVILAFPTNDYRQEPGSNENIAATVQELLGPELFHSPNFILFPKSSLKTNPVYRLLKKKMPYADVQHNFYKYMIGRDGLPLKFHDKKADLLESVTKFIARMQIHDRGKVTATTSTH